MKRYKCKHIKSNVYTGISFETVESMQMQTNADEEHTDAGVLIHQKIKKKIKNLNYKVLWNVCIIL